MRHQPTIDQIFSSLKLDHRQAGTSTGKSWISNNSKEAVSSFSPIDDQHLGDIFTTDSTNYEIVVNIAQKAFKEWRMIPAPKRGEIVRQFGLKLRDHKNELGHLVTIEMGKSIQEGLGEVQEMIDICDFAVGLSRQLHGLTMHSERPFHRMYEQYHPLGIVGIISAFNFPVAVWSWNAMVALVCGDVCIWKPSEKTPYCAVACQKLLAEVLADNGLPEGVSSLIVGDYEIGELLTGDSRIPLVSATGSVRMGRKVGAAIAGRLGKSILELGGNNAIIISQHADLKLTIPGVVFGAVGTSGQRCTSTRRLIIHERIYDRVVENLVSAYRQLKIGNPLDESNHVGPLIDEQAVQSYMAAGTEIVAEGGEEIIPAEVISDKNLNLSGLYVRPAIYAVQSTSKKVLEETFAPILYLLKYETLEEAIDIQNMVPQGLSSAIMTNDLKESEQFLAHTGSDCGIANVNIGTSGAEIGGAFGGEKDTGGGRESGSDAWKAYMRRQTNTINFGDQIPLAQGIKFDI